MSPQGPTGDDLLAQGRPGDTLGEVRFGILALIAGSLAGFVGSLFHHLIDLLIQWPQWLAAYADGWRLVAAASGIVMVCASVSVWIVRRWAPEAGGSGVQEIEGAMEGLRPVRWRRVLPVKFVAGVTAIASGLVLGREGPTIHIGASASAAVAETFRTNELERRGLLAGGGGQRRGSPAPSTRRSPPCCSWWRKRIVSFPIRSGPILA